jgi:L-histidine Nalpha-methyltransferase
VNTALPIQIECAAIAPTRSVASLAEDVSAGLFAEPRSLPPKYFYDARGSRLFDRICDQPEYYPTRTEGALLHEHALDIVGTARPDRILELGSGTSRKTRHLLDACCELGARPSYAPFDVCAEMLVASGAALSMDYAWLDVQPLSGDYTAGLGNLPRRAGRTLYVFLGGTIGNFAEHESAAFLGELRAVMQPGDRLLLGADRVKDPSVLHAAYNDGAGYTAAFNRNVLGVLNRELSADFDLDAFAHYAYFNPAESRIEMHLVALSRQRVEFRTLATALDFAEGDHILTEISRKFTGADLEADLRAAGFAVSRHYQSRRPSFSLVLAQPA